MKSLLILVTAAALALPFAACSNKTVVEDKDKGIRDRDHATVREDTTVHERDSMHDRDTGNSSKTYERETEKTRD